MITQSEATNDNLGFLIKTIIVGDAGVGKSSILKRFTQGNFCNNYNATIGLEFESKDVQINSDEPDEQQKITLQIWDTAGQESFRSIVKSFYRNSAAVLLVYDVTNKDSFGKLQDWIKEIRDNSHSDVIIILIGNKIDDEGKKISESQVNELVEEEGLAYHFYTSAKNGENIDKSFEYVAAEVYKKFIKGRSDLRDGISNSKSFSMDENKLLAEQMGHDQKQPTPQRNSSKNQKLNSSINKDVHLKEQLIDKSDTQDSQKKKCAC